MRRARRLSVTRLSGKGSIPSTKSILRKPPWSGACSRRRRRVMVTGASSTPSWAIGFQRPGEEEKVVKVDAAYLELHVLRAGSLEAWYSAGAPAEHHTRPVGPTHRTRGKQGCIHY